MAAIGMTPRAVAVGLGPGHEQLVEPEHSLRNATMRRSTLACHLMTASITLGTAPAAARCAPVNLDAWPNSVPQGTSDSGIGGSGDVLFESTEHLGQFHVIDASDPANLATDTTLLDALYADGNVLHAVDLLTHRRRLVAWDIPNPLQPVFLRCSPVSGTLRPVPPIANDDG